MTEPRRESIVLQGIGVSPGVVIGPAMLVRAEPLLVPQHQVPDEGIDLEIQTLEEALIRTRRQLKEIQAGLESKTHRSDGTILDAHLLVLDDRSFIEEVVRDIRETRRNVAASVHFVADRYSNMLASFGDDYLRERVADVKDVARRIIRNVSGTDAPAPDLAHGRHVIVARDLAPSETASLRKDMVTGFATDLGSPTSHTAVMARALEIPAIVGLHDISERVEGGDEVLLDGNKGVLILHPSADQLERYGRVAEARRTIELGFKSLQHEPAETRDGHRIVLSANVEDPKEVDSVLEYGAEGIGLFRSEYLYLSRDTMVSEDDQAAAYTDTARRLSPAPVIIRTLDIGGDKFFSDGSTMNEANPFLGCRSIRLSLLETDHFKAQLRAILRASAEGNVKIMYPMVSSADEVIRANELLGEAKEELRKKGVAFRQDIEVGAMIEIPSAALTADVLAEHVQFFSLGTNDLIQYTIAVDRGNERVAYLYEPTHPAVLRLIKQTVDAGHEKGIWVGLCGEMAGDPLMTPLLLGLGVDEFSVAPSAVPMIKDAIRSLRYAAAKELATTALSCRSAVEVLRHCRHLTREVAPELLELI